MRKVRYSPRAREDLLELWHYIASENPRAADRVLDRIEMSCSRLKDHPDLGSARPKIGEGARALIIERWIVMYRKTSDGVEIVRVVDGARDLSRLDWPSA